MKKMKSALLHEWQHFRSLSPSAQKLFLSTFIYYIADPLIFIFINAFLWRKTSNFITISAYNLGFFLTLPIAFYFNGHLLKKFSIKHLFFVGFVGQGLAVLPLFFFSHFSFLIVLLIGVIQGIPMGFYWANRNFITLSLTKDHQRNYYQGLESSVNLTLATIVPLVLGWFIVSGDYFHLYSIDQAYRFLILVITGLLIWGGLSFQSAEIEQPKIALLRPKNPSSKWKNSQRIEICQGFLDRMADLLPALVVVSLIGNESTLGTLQSLVAIIGAVVIYFIGRRTATHHRIAVLSASVALLVVCSVFFTFFPTTLTAILFITGLTLSSQVSWTALSPLQMNVIDREESGDPTNNYAYVVDRETFLNSGRVISMGIFFGLIYLSSQTFALRIIPLVIIASRVILVFLAKKAVRT